jgi:hypothetical protein
MGSCLIVSCLAIASLQSIRAQRRNGDGNSDATNAQLLAKAGLEYVQQQMKSSPTWRSTFTNGTEKTVLATGGRFIIKLEDPLDSNLANDVNHSVIVTSKGIVGVSTQTFRAFMEPQKKLYGGCQSALYSTDRMTLDDCNITANQWAFCAEKIKTQGEPTVNMNCLAQSQIQGSGFQQRTITGGVWPMEMPDLTWDSTSFAGKFYRDNSVIINATDLPTGGTELIANGGFEVDLNSWTSIGCTLTRDTSQKKSGNASCRVSARGLINTPVQTITQHVLKGHNYSVSVWIRPAVEQKFFPAITIYVSGALLPTVCSGPEINCKAGVWTQVSATIQPSWTGVMSKAELNLGSNNTSEYFMDDLTMKDNDREAGTRYIENVLLTNTTNPYGTKVASSAGMYLINAPSEKVLFRNCRIGATLVISYASEVRFEGGLYWEPTGRNYPALITNAAIDDETDKSTLSESTAGINFNPSTNPFAGVSDNDASDSYTTTVKGPIVSTEDILLEGKSSFTGPIICGKKIDVQASSVTIQFPSDIIMNPPPGFFASPPSMRMIASSLETAP